ncbi:conserved hypothetical protein [Gloeothece citriformis PCC 7424]|uniref:DUF2834 domain-containing protein n=1 Tax=Gloeothece citriformis (strain PCC 7424) TaxID=65393 RepID=B7KAC2_GLOC7|nr:hypothetical protein [Gloeothece citriformis]ACK72896.1 conserved hypothetical protein [Gloeothece citriformis PCC 7424]
MLRKVGFSLLWLGFVVYAFLFAPPEQPNTLELIKQLSLGQWENINPLVVAVFNLLGILPLVYACVILIDGRGQPIKAWLFVVGSFGVGAFALLPYLVFREKNPHFPGEKDFLLKILDSRWTGIILTLGAFSFVLFGLIKGDWSDFIEQWQTSRFIHVMSLDFCLVCLLFPSLLGDDLARRGIKKSWVFWLVSLTPLLGALFYLCLRPPLQETSVNTASPISS